MMASTLRSSRESALSLQGMLVLEVAALAILAWP